MRNRITVYEKDVINNQSISSITKRGHASEKVITKNIKLAIIAAEGYENFATYIEWLGLAKDPDMLVLSSLHHYYYDAEELKQVRTVVNLKEFNRIKKINKFIQSVSKIIPESSYFLGCFIDNERRNSFPLRNKAREDHPDLITEAVKNGIASRNPFLSMVYSIIDYKINRFLSRSDMTLLLEDRGFKILDMTELCGITYFCTQRQRSVN